MTEKDTIKELENQSKNVKHQIDKLTIGYIGMTIEELVRMALTGKDMKGGEKDD